MTLEELGDRIGALSGDMKALCVRVEALGERLDDGLGEGGKAMAEVRDELRLLRQGREDDRQRLTAVEGRVGTLEEARRQSREDRRYRWSPIATIAASVIAAGATCVAAFLAAVHALHGAVAP
jgi:hypothetical protein